MSRSTSVPIRPLPAVFIFSLIFCAIFLLHMQLLRLPYFWDEAGYFVPAAYDLYKTGDLIPHTTLSNAHPPVVMIWLAFWWKLSNFAPVTTRVAMLLVSATGLLGVYQTARRVSTTGVAIATVTLSALYPVIFAQSSLAQLDMPVFTFLIWAIYCYVTKRYAMSVALTAIACVTKETAVVVPLTLFGWEIISFIADRARWQTFLQLTLPVRPLWKTAAHLLSLLPLIAWYAYHFHRTGHVFGNPEFLRYNMGATITPFRVFVALLIRVWHAFGYMNLFVLTAAALIAMSMPALRDRNGERPPVELRVRILFLLLIAAHIVEFALLGGALLARYMVPVIPLVILLSVSTLRRHVAQWPLWTTAIAATFVAALLVNPPWRIAPEDNLAYSDFVRIHKAAAVYVEKHYPEDKILTAWPASDELNRPFLGYVQKPHTIIHLENFTIPQILAARQQRDSFDVVVAFNTKYEPPSSFFDRFTWWNQLQVRYFDFHSDMKQEEIAQMLNGQIVWQSRSGGEWVAVIEIPKIRNARLHTADLP